MPFLKAYGSRIRSVNWLCKGYSAVMKPTGNSPYHFCAKKWCQEWKTSLKEALNSNRSYLDFQCNILCEIVKYLTNLRLLLWNSRVKCFHSFKKGKFIFSSKSMVITHLYLGTLKLWKIQDIFTGVAWLNSKGLQHTSTYISLSRITLH